MNRTLLKALLSLALFLRCEVGTSGVKGAATAAIRQRTVIFSGDGSGDGDSYNAAGVKKYSNDSPVESSRNLLNKISSIHHIQLEYSGVTYASVSLDIVKADIVDEVKDVLTTHLGNDIEVVDVQRAYLRKLRGQPQRKLSYIRLVVTISLRHSSWISSERASATTIKVLSEYVDNDFRQYLRNLPGNGDYVGTVDVTNYYTGIAVGVPTADIPVNSPTQVSNGQTIGSFRFKLIFTEVSTHLANLDVLRDYVRYGTTRVLKDNLDSGIELLDASLEPWLPELWLTYTVLISLQYPTTQKDAFIHADEVLRRNTGDIDLYLDDYLATYSLSEAEKVELESAMKEVFGQMASVEIGDTPAPTPTPTKFVKPANDWLNTSADTLETIMPWWGWVILGIATAFIAVCCCCCITHFRKRKRASQAKKPDTVTNTIHVIEPAKIEPNIIGHSTVRLPATHERVPMSKSMNATDSFDENIVRIKRMMMDEYRLSRSLTLKPSQNPAHPILPSTDAIPYEPKSNALDPEQRLEPEKKKKKSKKKKQKNTVPYEPNAYAPDPEETLLEPKKQKKKRSKKKKTKQNNVDPCNVVPYEANSFAPDPEERILEVEEKELGPCTDVIPYEPNACAPDPEESIF